MITKRIQRRNANILKYHQTHYSNRQIGRIMHLSHTQIANILRKLEEEFQVNKEAYEETLRDKHFDELR